MRRLDELVAAIEKGDVVYDVRGKDRASVLANLVKLIKPPAGLGRAELASALVEREELATTAIGGGIALPHPRQRLAKDSNQAFVTLGYLDQPIEWDAPDGKPVSSVFLVISDAADSHLKILAGLACLGDMREFRSFLAQRPDKATLIGYLKALPSRA
ncbi:MAG TPA: PTS sugar transporter subunit IIA [Rectinemataceae bacterium]